jgi:hypothetical protein
MRNFIIVLCFFLLFSCTKKNTLNIEKKENKSSVNTFNEKLNKEINSDDLEIDNNNQKIIERRNYSNPFYKFWTLGGRYTTFSFYNNKVGKFIRPGAFGESVRGQYSCTFITNLEGFSDAIIRGNFPDLSINGTRNDDGDIWFYHDENGYYSFQPLSKVGVMYFSDYLSFDINDEGINILTHQQSNMYYSNKNFEIQYKYQDDELILFNYIEYEYTTEYPEGKENKVEMNEFEKLINKMIIRNYKKNDYKKDKKYDIVFINEDNDELKSLYIAVLRKNFYKIIDDFYEYWDYKYDNDFILGTDQLYYLTRKEIEIFEDCVYEYFNDKNKDDIKTKKRILDLLEELKNK